MFSYSGHTGRKRHTMSGHRMRHLMDNVGWTVHGKAVPFLHGRAIDGFFIMLCQDVSGHSWCRDRKTYGKSHPRDGFILRDVRLLEHGQRQFLIVELNSIDAPRRRPSADHQMMLHVGRAGLNSGLSQGTTARARMCEGMVQYTTRKGTIEAITTADPRRSWQCRF